MYQVMHPAKGTRLEAEGQRGDQCGCPGENTRDWIKVGVWRKVGMGSPGTGADRAEGERERESERESKRARGSEEPRTCMGTG